VSGSVDGEDALVLLSYLYGEKGVDALPYFNETK